MENYKRYLIHQKLTYGEIFEHMFAYRFQVVFASRFPADFVRYHFSNGGLELVLEGKIVIKHNPTSMGGGGGTNLFSRLSNTVLFC